jgi:hypothetical protein
MTLDLALPGFENANMTLQELERAAFQMGHPAAYYIGVAADAELANDGASNAQTHMQEAASQYPTEDFLCNPIEELQTLAKRMRGENKTALLAIIETLDAIQLDTGRSSEYGRDELRKAEAELELTL